MKKSNENKEKALSLLTQLVSKYVHLVEKEKKMKMNNRIYFIKYY